MRQEMVGLWDAVASAGPYAKTACRKIGKKLHLGFQSIEQCQKAVKNALFLFYHPCNTLLHGF